MVHQQAAPTALPDALRLSRLHTEKMAGIMYFRTVLSLLLLLIAPAVVALDQRGVVLGLEALGEWEAAYPLAVDLARERDDYPAWRRVAASYALYDQGGEAYQQAWDQARAIDNQAVYLDFIQIRPQSPSNRLAIHRIYELTRELDTVSGYQGFM